MPLLHRSITDLKEGELVSRILNDWHYCSSVLGINGLRSGNAQIRENEEFRSFRKGARGDVDILVVPRDCAGETTAIQVKRLEATVRMDARGNDEVVGGSLVRFRKLVGRGIEQANFTRRLGFSQVYLWIFVVIDARARNSGWYTYEGADSLLRSQISSAISSIGLDPTIGLVEFEWAQPMDRPPLEVSTYGAHLRRLAQSVAQPPELTARLQSLPPALVRLRER